MTPENETGPVATEPDISIINYCEFTAESPTLQACGTEESFVFSRPGIRLETLLKSRIKHVTPEGAEILCKSKTAGVWIQYFTLQDKPVLDGGEPFGRLRKDTAGSDKYHQEHETSSYIYIPVGFALRFNNGKLEFLIIVEGEFKALSLFEDGYPAIGFPGFFGYSSDQTSNTKTLLPDLKELLDIYEPKKVFFLGDGDTSVNIDFTIAALTLAKLIHPIPLLLPRLPISGPKGIDDFKESLP